LLMLRPRPAAVTPPATQTETSPAPPADPAGNAAQDDVVQAVTAGVELELTKAEKNFQNAVDLLNKSGSAVPPETVKVLQESFNEMTDAMEKGRKALESDPQNAAARESFYDLLRQKIRFLQDTIALMSEMWQGDAAGAAQIVEGGKS
jgi:hypothetical protein